MAFTQENLTPTLEEALSQHDSAEQFVIEYLSGVTRALVRNPLQYRSFGVHWWQLKSLLIDSGITHFGEALETETLKAFKLPSDELVCCAAFAMQQQRLAAGCLLSSEHLIDTEEAESLDYILVDEEMEQLAISQEMLKQSKQAQPA